MRVGLPKFAPIVLLCLAGALGACGGGAVEGPTGTVEIDGSSTVFPISQAVAEEFRSAAPRAQVNVGVSGTGGGFQRFVEGETDISNASRPIKASEEEQAVANGVEFIQMRIGTDGLSVVVHPNNDWADCMTVEELRRTWEPGSTVERWSDIRSSFPDDELHLYGPDTDSGTFDYFTEVIVGEVQASRSDYTASADDNVLVTGVSGDRLSMGYFGFAYFTVNEARVKAVAIDNGDGCVAPTRESIESDEYQPLSRPLYLYVNTESLEREIVREYLRFYMENAAALVAEVGYVAAADDIYMQNLADAGIE